MKPLYLLVVFWGEKFRNYFLDLLVPSLLADNNLPAISNKAPHAFLIATTPEDWRILQTNPRFQAISNLIQVKFLDISHHLGKYAKMKTMSCGHREVSEMAYQNRGVGVFLTPDMILTESALSAIAKILSNGYEVVLCPAVRFEYEGCMRELERRKLLASNKLSLTGAELMSIVLDNLHSETKTWVWNDECYADNPVVTLGRLSGRNNYVFHCYSWAPLAFDYSHMEKHDISTFENHTLDQDYVYNNYGTSERIYVVTDSDELALASFTSEEELNISTASKPYQHLHFTGLQIKQDNLSRFHHSPIHNMDPLKKKLVVQSVLMHAEPFQSEWKAEINEMRKTVIKAISKKPLTQVPLYVIFTQVHELMRYMILRLCVKQLSMIKSRLKKNIKTTKCLIITILRPRNWNLVKTLVAGIPRDNLGQIKISGIVTLFLLSRDFKELSEIFRLNLSSCFSKLIHCILNILILPLYLLFFIYGFLSYIILRLCYYVYILTHKLCELMIVGVRNSVYFPVVCKKIIRIQLRFLYERKKIKYRLDPGFAILKEIEESNCIDEQQYFMMPKMLRLLFYYMPMYLRCRIIDLFIERSKFILRRRKKCNMVTRANQTT